MAFLKALQAIETLGRVKDYFKQTTVELDKLAADLISMDKAIKGLSNEMWWNALIPVIIRDVAQEYDGDIHYLTGDVRFLL